MSAHLIEAYAADIAERRQGLERANAQGWRVCAHEITPGVVYRTPQVTIEAFAVDHGSWDAFGYRLQTTDRCIVVSGDTAPTETMVEQSRGSDLLIHEVYSAIGLTTRPGKWQEYHRSVHTSTRELAQMMQRARPGQLVVYHQLLWGRTEQELMAEIREHYDGPAVFGADLGVY